MVVAITSNAAIKTESNAAFIHCCNYTAFCRVEGGKQSCAEETRRGQSGATAFTILVINHMQHPAFTYFSQYFIKKKKNKKSTMNSVLSTVASSILLDWIPAKLVPPERQIIA